ncbi:hypothetical protein M514_15346 [Trichuris suis]|uniref:Uncharacterized protein n=1 Tax=Trichuris suis TaxID=68888 RepID=A0A085NSR4_9BILA|nr:hypothetical protein M514_15346 [Trichuris suis]
MIETDNVVDTSMDMSQLGSLKRTESEEFLLGIPELELTPLPPRREHTSSSSQCYYPAVKSEPAVDKEHKKRQLLYFLNGLKLLIVQGYRKRRAKKREHKEMKSTQTQKHLQ